MEREEVFRKLREIGRLVHGEILQMKHEEKGHNEAYDTFIYTLKTILLDSDLEGILESMKEKKESYDLTFLKEMETKCEKDLDDYCAIVNDTIGRFIYPNRPLLPNHDYMDFLIKKFVPKFRENFIKEKMQERINLFVKNIP
jgi:hypothetical protein